MLTLQDLGQLFNAHAPAAAARVRPLRLAGRLFDFEQRPVIMGVVNLSPDSWYRESVCLTVESAVRRARVLHEQGADLIDLGAESTLVHAARVGAADQARRLLPVIRALRQAGLLVSVETYTPAVARACLEAGANVLNLTGNVRAAEFFRMAADHDAAVIVCYVEGRNVRAVRDLDLERDPLERMREHFARRIEAAHACGLDKIILDPGLGFYYRNLKDGSLRVRRQMNVFLNTFRLRTLGCPVCHALPHAFEYFGEEVRCAEPFFAVLAALGRTDVFRTHEVPRIRAVLETLRVFHEASDASAPAQERPHRKTASSPEGATQCRSTRKACRSSPARASSAV